tara:strand:+ start:73 stop:1368 length:1296 start_codon:yes stop_codon:yes gene_type:complete
MQPNNNWKEIIRIETGETRAHYAAWAGELPDNFHQWNIKDKRGRSVAHMAATFNNLPPDFWQWNLRDDQGRTVAHEYVEYRPLPKHFNQWGLADSNGVTVAHIAAEHLHLPIDFDQWDLADNFNETVAHIEARVFGLFDDFNQWELTDKGGDTVAHVQASFHSFPETFTQYHLLNGRGETVACKMAQRGKLRETFKDWDVQNVDGTTVIEIAEQYRFTYPDQAWVLDNYYYPQKEREKNFQVIQGGGDAVAEKAAQLQNATSETVTEISVIRFYPEDTPSNYVCVTGINAEGQTVIEAPYHIEELELAIGKEDAEKFYNGVRTSLYDLNIPCDPEKRILGNAESKAVVGSINATRFRNYEPMEGHFKINAYSPTGRWLLEEEWADEDLPAALGQDLAEKVIENNGGTFWDLNIHINPTTEEALEETLAPTS